VKDGKEEYLEIRGGKGNVLQARIDTEKKIKGLSLLEDNIFLVSVFDMLIFDKDDNLSVSIKCLTNCKIDFENCLITANDAAFNLSLIKFINDYNETKSTDYKNLTKPTDFKMVGQASNYAKDCKVILEGDLYNRDGNKKYVLKYCFPSCLIFSQGSFEAAANGVAEHPIKIQFGYDKEIEGYYEIILE